MSKNLKARPYLCVYHSVASLWKPIKETCIKFTATTDTLTLAKSHM